MSAKYAAYCVAMAAAANAIVGPNLPWGGVVDVAGQDCKIGWALDTTGLWKNMSIELMTGDNQAFVHLSWVAHGLDGTSGDGTYTWTCPVVDPPAPIYFYQFTNPGQPATYTTRFTLAAADGTTVAAPEQTQPTGENIPWGTGSIISGGDGTADSGSSSGGGGGSSPSSSNTTSAGSSSSGNGGASASTPRGSSNAAASSSSTGASSTDASTDADTTVVTVQPSTSAATRSNTRAAGASSSSTGVSSAIGGNANGNNNSTGAATSAKHVSGNMMAGLGLILAVSAGWIIA